MNTQEELRSEFQRLFDADMLDEAEAVLKQLKPVSDEEWLKMLEEAPVEDEPLTAKEQQRLESARIRRKRLSRQAG